MHRSLRRLATWLALVTFAVAQLAISAYACPADIETRAPAAAVASDGDSCPELANANLCESHCDYGSSAVATHVDSMALADVALVPWGTAPVLDESVRLPGVARIFDSAAPPLPASPIPLRI